MAAVRRSRSGDRGRNPRRLTVRRTAPSSKTPADAQPGNRPGPMRDPLLVLFRGFGEGDPEIGGQEGRVVAEAVAAPGRRHDGAEAFPVGGDGLRGRPGERGHAHVPSTAIVGRPPLHLGDQREETVLIGCLVAQPAG